MGFLSVHYKIIKRKIRTEVYNKELFVIEFLGRHSQADLGLWSERPISRS